MRFGNFRKVNKCFIFLFISIVVYRFNISSVSGPGHPDPETAFKEKTINMIAEVKVWDDGEVGDIVFDGQHYISLNPGRVLEFGKIETQLDLTIKTDVLAGFKITKITDNAGNALTGTDLWFSVGDYQLGAFYGKNEREEVIPLKINENTTGAERIAYVYVEAGRMNVLVKIIQSNYSRNVFEFISMENITGKGLNIPREGGQIKVTANANIPWKLKARRGTDETVLSFTPTQVGGEVEEGVLILDIEPLSRFWKDDQEMETDIDVWIEYELDGQTVEAQKTIYHQEPYDMTIPENNIDPIEGINKFGQFIELKIKGYLPSLPFRVVNDAGEVVSDIEVAPAIGDILNTQGEATIRFLVYPNYTNTQRNLYIECQRPSLEGGVEHLVWKKIGATIIQKSNGMTLPQSGYEATPGVLGIGAKTGKLRLDGSYGYMHGKATYIDKDGNIQPEKVYMVTFKWGSLYALKIEKLAVGQSKTYTKFIYYQDPESGEDVFDEEVITPIQEAIVWVPPGFKGSITSFPEVEGDYATPPIDAVKSYNALPYHAYAFMPSNDLTKGYGDPCSLAQNIFDGSYGSYRIPYGILDDQEDYVFGGGPEFEDHNGDKFLINKYYPTTDGRHYIPAHGMVYYDQAEDVDDESMGITKTVVISNHQKVNYAVYWTKTSVTTSDPSNKPQAWQAYTFQYSHPSWGGGAPFPTDWYVNKSTALPIRCVK